jgi:hypothetical protein
MTEDPAPSKASTTRPYIERTSKCGMTTSQEAAAGLPGPPPGPLNLPAKA